MKKSLFPIAGLLLAGQILLAQNWFQTNQNADLMLSGVDFNNTGGALLFNHPSGIASDGEHFILCDRFNNRVLVWNTLPESWNQLPDLVLGQSNFTENNPGAAKNQLSWAGNASAANNRLAVADTDNDRILLWNTFPTNNGQAADVSISLPALAPPGNPAPYGWPWGVWTDGNRLAAVATRGGALLFWNSWPLTDNQAPDYVISLPEFGTPRNISTDGSTYFFVGDHNAMVNGQNKPGTFFWNTYPTADNQPFDFYRNEWIKGVKLPDGKLLAAGILHIHVWNNMPTDAGQDPDLSIQNGFYKNGDGVDAVYAGGKIWVNNYNGNNVWVYEQTPAAPQQTPDFCLGAASWNLNTLDDIHYIQNPVLATDGARLVASSDYDREIWIWNQLPTQSGQPADVKIALSANNGNLAPWDNALSNNRLVVGGKNAVAVWNTLPATNNTPPDRFFANAIGSASLTDITGIALDESYLYVAERNGKIYIWQGIPVNSNENPYKVIELGATPLNHLHSDGQYLCATVQSSGPAGGAYIFKVADFAGPGAPQPYKTVLSAPALHFNLPAEAITFGNAFALANTNSSQVLVWKNLDEAGDPASAIVLGQPDLNSTHAKIGINRLYWPGSMAAAGNKLWVGEFKFSSRIVQYSYSTNTAAGEPGTSSAWQVSPNPCQNQARVSFKGKAADAVDLFDGVGRTIEAPYSNGILHTANLPAGVYWLRARSGEAVFAYRLFRAP